MLVKGWGILENKSTPYLVATSTIYFLEAAFLISRQEIPVQQTNVHSCNSP